MVDQDELKNRVISRLKEDLPSADLKLSLLYSASCSYRHDTVLRPFPSMFIANGEKQYNLLVDILHTFPSLSDVLQKKENIGTEELHLLNWLLDTKIIDLKTCDKTKYEEIQKLTGQTLQVPKPNYIFEVIHGSCNETKFQERTQGKKTMYAYHGSRLENFHSILYFGLNSHMNKNALFGEGTYLSSELSVSMPYCPSGKSWDQSLLGNSLACVAVCELIDDPAVKCHVKDQQGKVNTSRTKVAGSEGGDVPEKYYIVQNNDVIRVKYLLVYGTKSAKILQKKSAWWVKHKFELMVVFYVVLLLAIGIANSRTFQRYLKFL